MNKIKQAIQFLKDSAREATLITWPTPPVILKQFLIVLVLSALIVLILYLFDMGFASMISNLKQLIK